MAAKKLMAKDLWKERDVVLNVSEKKIVSFKDGFNTIPADSFPSDTITVIRANTYTKTSTQLFYFDEKAKAERPIVVPNDFLFTPADKETTKKMMDQFREWMLTNLSAYCRYLGGQIGSDPEIFIETGKGELIPAFNFLPAKSSTNYVYWDGFQAEFTPAANSCMQVHSEYIQGLLNSLLDLARKYDKTAKFSIKTVFDVNPEQLNKAKPEHVAFGCRESFNAYGMTGRKAPGEEVTFRSAGGHIHFGLSDDLKKNKDGIVKMVKALDAVLGVACVSMFAKYDDPRRRTMYGLAGEYRLPPHGLEYRTLSNAWLFHPMIAHLVFDLARSTTTFGYKDFLKYWQCEEKETIRIINECDVSAARDVLKKNRKILLAIINTRYSNMEQAEFVFDVLYYGMDSVLKNPADLVNNWKLYPDSREGWRSFKEREVRAAMNSGDKV